VLLPATVLALGLGGLPLTGGALAKLAVKGQFGEGVVGALATLSAAGSTLLMLHFLRRLVQTAPRGSDTALPVVKTWSWLITAFAALAVPWGLYSTIGSGPRLEAFAPATLWAASWPVLIGAVLAAGLGRWGNRLPRVRAGDVVVIGEAAFYATVPWGKTIERADLYLRQWPVASLSLLGLAIILGAAMLAVD
jgi:hypothetical protein